MKEKDEITDLFRRRLKQAQIEVRDDFWESLQQDLSAVPMAQEKEKKEPVSLWLYKFTVAASILLVLGVASATFWYFSQKENIQQAFTQVQDWQSQAEAEGGPSFSSPSSVSSVSSSSSSSSSLLSSSSSSGPISSSSISSSPLSAQVSAASYYPFRKSSAEEDVFSDTAEGNVSVRFSITIRQQQYGAGHDVSEGYRHPVSEAGMEQATPTCVSEADAEYLSVGDKPRKKWAFKAAVGTALPKGDFHAPIVAGGSAERMLGKRLALEAGVQYHRLSADGDAGETCQVLAVPVKMNVVCADSKRWLCYASVGGAVEKVLDKGFDTDPLRLSVSAGIGVAYKLNSQLALFVEPGISHHFDTESDLKNLRSERATNMNLLCGMRITY